jgi:hypothetical protein
MGGWRGFYAAQKARAKVAKERQAQQKAKYQACQAAYYRAHRELCQANV